MEEVSSPLPPKSDPLGAVTAVTALRGLVFFPGHVGPASVKAAVGPPGQFFAWIARPSAASAASRIASVTVG